MEANRKELLFKFLEEPDNHSQLEAAIIRLSNEPHMEAIKLKTAHLTHALSMAIKNELTLTDLSEWADSIIMNDDIEIDHEIIREILIELANSENSPIDQPQIEYYLHKLNSI